MSWEVIVIFTTSLINFDSLNNKKLVAYTKYALWHDKGSNTFFFLTYGAVCYSKDSDLWHLPPQFVMPTSLGEIQL